MKTKDNTQQVHLDKIVSGGQALGTLSDGRKLFCWGGLPNETVRVQITKQKSHFLEGIAADVITASPDRVAPVDPDSYLSTSPWQIMSFDAEQRYKAELIRDAFSMQKMVLPSEIDIYNDQAIYGYRNKIEFSWYWDNERECLELSFYRRGSHGKIPVSGTSLARPEINQAAGRIRDLLRGRGVQARQLKTLMLRCDQQGNVAAQLYVMQPDFTLFSDQDFVSLNIRGFEMIMSDPHSPASVITKRLQSLGKTSLSDTVLGVPFRYTVDSFFQINLPVYQQALGDMQAWVEPSLPTVDLYSGVGSIGLTVGGSDVTLVEINQSAVSEMKRNIAAQKRPASVKAVLAASEQATNYILPEQTVIVDPPRAGLHSKVVTRLLEVKPQRIIYLSCNPVTQARDIALLAASYDISYHRGYNFFPRTPHIEHLVVLDLRQEKRAEL